MVNKTDFKKITTHFLHASLLQLLAVVIVLSLNSPLWPLLTRPVPQQRDTLLLKTLIFSASILAKDKVHVPYQATGH